MAETNRHGVKVEELVISVTSGGASFIHADTFIRAMRDIAARAPLVHVGLDEFTPSELFVLQMAKIFKDCDHGGTLTTMPNDIMEIWYPGHIAARDKAAAEKEKANVR